MSGQVSAIQCRVSRWAPLTSSQCGGAVPCCLRSESRSQRVQGSVAVCELQWKGAV